LAHCLVKHLYGRTNKRDATRQIGRHVRQLERARCLAEQDKLDVGKSLNEDMEQDINVHHHIAKSQKDPMNIYSYIYANRGDPAFMVCYTFEYRVLCLKLINISNSYQN
jgi:hypothetical protein